MERTSDHEFKQQLNDPITFIWTPKAVEMGKAKREKRARDKSLELIENNKIEKDYKL